MELKLVEVATWNIQGLGNNGTEPNTNIKEYKVNISAITEPKIQQKNYKIM